MISPGTIEMLARERQADLLREAARRQLQKAARQAR